MESRSSKMLVRVPIIVLGDCLVDNVERQEHCGFSEQRHFHVPWMSEVWGNIDA